MHEAAKSAMNTALAEAARILTGAENLLVLTGAGISAESGLATFRGANGLYDKWPDLAAVLSAEGLARDPQAIWDFIDTFRIQAAAAEPNEAHRILAQWEQAQRFRRFLIATQNIDGLHQRAGSRRVSELHGSAWQIACPRERELTSDEAFAREFQCMLADTPDRENILRSWSEANGRDIWEDREVPFRAIPPSRDEHVRPNVLLFDEEYGSRLLWVQDFIRQRPDAVLVIGCSGTLSVLWHLLGDCRQSNPRCQVININADKDAEIPDAIHVCMNATEGMRQLESAMRTIRAGND
jgi:NAD-dependent SIR2 family protein deacetylase